MKKFFYLLLMTVLILGFVACSDNEPATEEPPTEEPGSNGEDVDSGNGGEPGAADDPVTGNTLIVYYSFTNNVHTIVSDLQTQIDADVLRVEPAEEGIDYAANNYAVGSALISAIRNNPDDASSYPDIRTTADNLDEYDIIIVAAPLWWSNMAAPMQTFLFRYGDRMAGKHIGLVVSSASSGISGVEADAERLIPEGNFMEPSLWIRSSQTAACHSMLADWLEDINYVSPAAN